MTTPPLTSNPFVTDLPLIQHPILSEEISQMLLKGCATVSEKGGLAGINICERCLLSCSNLSGTQKVPHVCLSEKGLPIQSAPRVFTKMLVPMVGVHIYPYLDDCLIIAKSRDMLLSFSAAILGYVERCRLFSQC